MRVFILFLFVFQMNHAFSQSGDEKVIYKYKKYEKFDFDELSVTGEGGAPGDLSITPRTQKKFQNKLPLRENFNPEMRKSLERVQ